MRRWPRPSMHGMDGNDVARLENAHLVGDAVHLDDAPARAVRHAVEVAVDRDHAVTGDAALEPQHRLERSGREWLQLGRSSAKCSATTRLVVACTRTLATWSSHCSSCC